MTSNTPNPKTIDNWRIAQGVILTALILASIAPAVSAADTRALTFEEKQGLVEIVCEKIDTLYPFKEIATETLEGLMQHFEAGELNEITDAKLFAAAVTVNVPSRVSAFACLKLCANNINPMYPTPFIKINV